MLLLPSSLFADRTSLKSLCEALPAHPELALCFDNASFENLNGTWTDALRECVGASADLPFANAQSHTNDATTVALATPLAATLGLTDLTVLDAEQTRLSEKDSRKLCDAANTHLAQDGILLKYLNATEWLFESTRSIEVLTEHPMFVAGENMRQFLPRGRDARLVERWMNELQMLLFSHQVNAERQQNSLLPINVVWLHSFSPANATATNIALPTTLFVEALKRGDVKAWQAAWTTLEPEILRADEVILGDAFPRVRLRFVDKKRGGLFSWFAKKPTLGEVLMRLHQRAFDISPAARGQRDVLGEG